MMWRRASRYDAANGTVLSWIMKPSALAGNRPPALREPKEAQQRRRCAVVGRGGRGGAARHWQHSRQTSARRSKRHSLPVFARRSRGAAESAARDHQDAHSFTTAQAAHSLTAKIGGARTPRKVYDAAGQLSALLFRLTTPRTNPNTGI